MNKIKMTLSIVYIIGSLIVFATCLTSCCDCTHDPSGKTTLDVHNEIALIRAIAADAEKSALSQQTEEVEKEVKVVVDKISEETSIEVKVEEKKAAQVMYEEYIKKAADSKYEEVLENTKQAIIDGKSEFSVNVPKYVGYEIASKLKKEGFYTTVEEDSLNECKIIVDIDKLRNKYD